MDGGHFAGACLIVFAHLVHAGVDKRFTPQRQCHIRDRLYRHRPRLEPRGQSRFKDGDEIGLYIVATASPRKVCLRHRVHEIFKIAEAPKHVVIENPV
jgi:hypothetical protein